jgi:hypothetical protein
LEKITRLAWAQEVPGSNPGAPTKISPVNTWRYTTTTSPEIFLSIKPRQEASVCKQFHLQMLDRSSVPPKAGDAGVHQRKTEEKCRFTNGEKIDYGEKSGDPLHF